MCLLYLGKNPTPGVEKDYHLSPILAPSTVLADLPPLFLQCGARDPLVDDTVLFGGRVRAAKREAARTRRANVECHEQVEGHLPTPPCENTHRAEELEEDVTVQIFPGWSHGYLQMAALMPGAKVAINDIADWMNATFEQSRGVGASVA